MHLVPPDPDWYFEHVLAYAEPGTSRLRPPAAAFRWQSWWASRVDLDRTGVVGLAAGQGFVLTTAQARAAGLSRQRTRTLARHGAWSVPARGVLAPVDVRDADGHVAKRKRHALEAAASALNHPDHVVSGRSAAILHGLPTLDLPARPELTDAEPTGLGRRTGAHLYGATLTFSEVTAWFGAPVTTIPRTIVDLARHDSRDAIMAVDAALAEGLVTRRQLAVAMDEARGWPGIRQARAVLALADDRAESPLESLTRLRLVQSGLGEPDLQVHLGEYRVDMLYRDRRLVIEVDGLGKYTRAEIQREKRREARLRALGYRVERVTWDDLMRYWPETLARLTSQLRLPA